jgi:DNA-binding transcriptional regulator YdaS (Cro superfamily)
MNPSPIVVACETLGGQAETANLLDITRPAVYQWCDGRRPVPAERCPEIERLTQARGKRVSCEALRPDVRWVRIPDAAWPDGKPLLDLTLAGAPAPAEPAAQEVASHAL